MGILYLLSIFFLCYLLGKATGLITDSLRRLHHHIRVNEFLAAFFILGTITSIPELAVAIASIAQNEPAISFGNLLGANIVVFTLMIGLTALVSGRMSIWGLLKKEDFFFALFITAAPALFILDGNLDRWEGAAMIILFLYFLLHFYRRRSLYKSHSVQEESAPTTLPRELGVFLFAGILLLGASHFLVEISLSAALLWGVPALLVGLLLISIGTNVPEVAFVLGQATRKGERNRAIATGILLGNTAANLPIFGLLALFSPFSFPDATSIRIVAGLLVLAVIAVGVFMLSHRKMTRLEGFFLILIYCSFVLYSLSQFAI